MKKPNYKALAEHYRKKYYYAETRVAGMYEALRREGEALRKKEQELDEWQTKYVKVLNQLIDIQERVLRKEEQG